MKCAGARPMVRRLKSLTVGRFDPHSIVQSGSHSTLFFLPDSL